MVLRIVFLIGILYSLFQGTLSANPVIDSLQIRLKVVVGNERIQTLLLLSKEYLEVDPA